MSRGLVVAVAGILVVAGFGIAAAVPADRALVVTDAATGERLLATPVAEGTVVVLAYTHSVERTPVRDVYAVRGDRLVMTRMEFESYGWGLPAGANVTRENGTFVFDPDTTHERLTVKPGRVADHRLVVGDREYDLVALSDARSVRIAVENRSLLAAARGAVA